MVEDVVFRYVKAIKSEKVWLDEILLALEKLTIAIEDKKVKDIILSYEISKDKKVELLNSIIDSEKVHNLVKLLSEKNRLVLISDIYTQLKKDLELEQNNYKGVVYSKDALGENELSELRDKFAKKFSINLELENIYGNYDGLKIEIEDLGVEIGFSNKLIKSQLKDFILKAI